MSMTIKSLRNTIVKNQGYILSDGTCNLQHLLPKAHDVIYVYNLRAMKLRRAIVNVFKPDKDTREYIAIHGLFAAQYYGKVTLDDEQQETANYLWNETIYNLFNNIAPEGYYFGSSESDGACIGWFKYTDESEE